MKVKICGLSRMEDVEYVNEAMPDYAGFVFAGGRRAVSPERAAELRGAMDAGIASVGVFRDADPALIARLFDEGVIDMAQLHGSEGAEYIREVQGVGAPAIKAVAVSSAADVSGASGIPAAHVLFDSGPGGTGRSFDWSLLAHADRPFFLAGGISLGNVADAMAAGPYAIDVSGGVETEGLKDRAKIMEIVGAARAAEGKER
ncbi:MAG: phosphoribosylanthranilate isomerase [Candidatus Methanoplasma sp.]|nr:phosphoribosylanthranilate isomerase [Candidatus Methanoplasma sp.]